MTWHLSLSSATGARGAAGAHPGVGELPAGALAAEAVLPAHVGDVGA